MHSQGSFITFLKCVVFDLLLTRHAHRQGEYDEVNERAETSPFSRSTFKFIVDDITATNCQQSYIITCIDVRSRPDYSPPHQTTMYICLLKIPEQCCNTRHYTSIKRVNYMNVATINHIAKGTSGIDRISDKLAQSQCCTLYLCKEFEQPTSDVSIYACLVVED